MGKIYILGNENSTSWAKTIGELITVPTFSINNSAEIHDFVVRTFSDAKADDKVVLDLDQNAMEPALMLTIAMHIRLSVESIKEASFLPILFVSCLPLSSFLTLGECSQMFLSQSGVTFCTPDEVVNAVNVDSMRGLTPDEYESAFLNHITIRPDENMGRHSMANQWGADVLNRIVSRDDRAMTDDTVNAKKVLYYKYIYVSTIGVNDILTETTRAELRRNEQRSAAGKKILLIDDEAEKGWKSVLEKWLVGYKSFDCIHEPIGTYEDIPENYRRKIEEDYYDLYLLDLRLLGNSEDDIFDVAEFSGMKVLKAIKAVNRGNQVIMMTASNKAWNMKALLDEGADGYYIKESPEFKFPRTFSEANFRSFSKEVNLAFENSDKKKVYREICNIKNKIIASTAIDENLANEISSTLLASLNQQLSAKTKNDHAYSYLSLFQIFELICRDYITRGMNDKWIIDNTCTLHRYKVSGSKLEKQDEITDEFPSIADRIVGVYVEVGHDDDARFIEDGIRRTVRRRNAFVHHDLSKLGPSDIGKVYTSKGFIHLLNTIKQVIDKLCMKESE